MVGTRYCDAQNEVNFQYCLQLSKGILGGLYFNIDLELQTFLIFCRLELMVVILNFLIFRTQTRYELLKEKDFFVCEGQL